MYQGKKWVAVRPSGSNGYWAVCPEGADQDRGDVTCFGTNAETFSAAIAAGLNLLPGPGDETVNPIAPEDLHPGKKRPWGVIRDIFCGLILVGLIIWMALVALPALLAQI